jgi:hypothetical protein
MLPLGTKQSGGKLLPHSDLRGGVFLGGVSRSRQRKRVGGDRCAQGGERCAQGGEKCAQGVGGEA